MGSGKSALGRQLAQELQAAFVDLDEIFEERYRVSIFDFFEKYGEETFRKLERELLFETARLENAVISTGGGTPCFFENMNFISKHGISVYLRMSSAELAERLKNIKKKRPLIRDLSSDGLEKWISLQLKIREEFYTKATHIFHPLTENIGELIRKLK